MPPAPGLGAQNAPGRGLCLCSILKTAVDYLWQFTKNKRPLDKYMGGGGIIYLEFPQGAGTE